MNSIFANTTVSVTELKQHYSAVIRALEEGGPVAVLNHNKPEAYILSARAYERLLERLEDLEDLRVIAERQNGPFVDVDINELRASIPRGRVEGVE
jgi:antitoxin StbD